MRILFILSLLAIAPSALAQRLTGAAVAQMAQSLVDQQVLTAEGRDELLRFASRRPLHLYEGLPPEELQNVRHSVLFAEGGFLEFVPGSEYLTKTILDSVAAIKAYPWSDCEAQLQEAYFLLDSFPCARDLYDFIDHTADFYRLNYTADLSYDSTKEQLALSRSAKLMSARLVLDGRLYEEVIDEKEFEDWIRPENFQFLNHVMEDRREPRRFFFIKPNLFTGYEPQQPDTVYIALLTEKQWQLLQHRYLFGRVEGCYNGSPGDYDYSIYPGEYFWPESRLGYEQIAAFVQRYHREHNISMKEEELPYLLATLREKNPHDENELRALLEGKPAEGL